MHHYIEFLNSLSAVVVGNGLDHSERHSLQRIFNYTRHKYERTRNGQDAFPTKSVASPNTTYETYDTDGVGNTEIAASPNVTCEIYDTSGLKKITDEGGGWKGQTPPSTTFFQRRCNYKRCGVSVGNGLDRSERPSLQRIFSYNQCGVFVGNGLDHSEHHNPQRIFSYKRCGVSVGNGLDRSERHNPQRIFSYNQCGVSVGNGLDLSERHNPQRICNYTRHKYGERGTVKTVPYKECCVSKYNLRNI